jgi:predicted Na+-dependent transporter
VLVPALVAFLGSLTDQPFNISSSAVAGQVLVAVVLPLVAGMLLRAFLPRLALRLEKPLALVANVVLLAAVAILIVAVFPQLTEVFTLNTAAAFVAFTALGWSLATSCRTPMNSLVHSGDKKPNGPPFSAVSLLAAQRT